MKFLLQNAIDCFDKKGLLVFLIKKTVSSKQIYRNL